MSARAIAWAQATVLRDAPQPTGMSRSEVQLLMLIASQVPEGERSVSISLRRATATLSMAHSTVDYAAGRLRDRGFVEVLPTFTSDGGRSSNRYVLPQEVLDV